MMSFGARVCAVELQRTARLDYKVVFLYLGRSLSLYCTFRSFNRLFNIVELVVLGLARCGLTIWRRPVVYVPECTEQWRRLPSSTCDITKINPAYGNSNDWGVGRTLGWALHVSKSKPSAGVFISLYFWWKPTVFGKFWMSFSFHLAYNV